MIIYMKFYFSVLPLLKDQCSNRAVPLEHILQSNDTELNEIHATITNLDAIGDSKVLLLIYFYIPL